jgi:hypothetical protein
MLFQGAAIRVAKDHMAHRHQQRACNVAGIVVIRSMQMYVIFLFQNTELHRNMWMPPQGDLCTDTCVLSGASVSAFADLNYRRSLTLQLPILCQKQSDISSRSFGC